MNPPPQIGLNKSLGHLLVIASYILQVAIFPNLFIENIEMYSYLYQWDHKLIFYYVYRQYKKIEL